MRKVVLVFAMMMTALGVMVPVWADGGDLDKACNTAMNEDVRAAAGCNDADANMGTVTTIIKGILNTIIGLVGVIAVIMIVIAGINMTVSQGDAAKVAKARSAMLYAVIGLAVAILSFAIVNFVLGEVF